MDNYRTICQKQRVIHGYIGAVYHMYSHIIGFFFLIQTIGDFTGSSRLSFPHSLAAKDDQIIFSSDCVTEGFRLSDPDQLTALQIKALKIYWWGQQSKGVVLFIALNASPNHWVSSKKKSDDLKGKCKMEYVQVDMDEEGSEGRNNIPIASDGDEEMPPAVKIGPLKRTGKRNPTCTEDPVQVPDDSMLFAPLPGPSTLPLPKHAPKKRIRKKTPPDDIVRLTSLRRVPPQSPA